MSCSQRRSRPQAEGAPAGGGCARLDLIAKYKINDTFTAFVRAENLTDTKYEVVYNYGTPGVSVYAGLTAKF